MGENKRFRVNDLVKYDYSEIGEYIDENHTDRPLRNDEVCDLLHEQQDTIKKLKSDKAIAEDYANIFEMENVKLRKKLNTLSEENEQLKKYCTVLKNQIKTMGEIGGFNKHMIKTILESNYDD